MFIAHKSNKIISIHEVEWECRRIAKGLATNKYWPWLTSVTSVDSDGKETFDFSDEDYEIIETKTEVDVQGLEKSGHIYPSQEPGERGGYHLKWDASKKEVVKDDDAKTAWELAQQWRRIRTRRDVLLTASDWTQGADSPLTSAKKTEWATYRTKLRTLPEDQKDKKTYASITWPSEPS